MTNTFFISYNELRNLARLQLVLGIGNNTIISYDNGMVVISDTDTGYITYVTYNGYEVIVTTNYENSETKKTINNLIGFYNADNETLIDLNWFNIRGWHPHSYMILYKYREKGE